MTTAHLIFRNKKNRQQESSFGKNSGLLIPLLVSALSVDQIKDFIRTATSICI